MDFWLHVSRLLANKPSQKPNPPSSLEDFRFCIRYHETDLRFSSWKWGIMARFWTNYTHLCFLHGINVTESCAETMPAGYSQMLKYHLVIYVPEHHHQ